MPSSADGRWERGLDALSSQLGVARDDVFERLRARFGERMATEAVSAVGGAWTEDSPLSLRDRSLLVVAALVTLGGAGERLRPLAVYAGFPRATVAMELIREELAAMHDSPAEGGA